VETAGRAVELPLLRAAPLAYRRPVLSRYPALLRWRPAGPVAWSALVAGVLAAVGISFGVIAPLAAGPPRTDSLPVTSASPGAPPSAAPSPSATAPAAPSPSVRPSVLEDQLVQLVNGARDRAGCDKAHDDGHLHGAAREHSQDMARKGFVDHDGSDGSSPGDRMRKAGYKHPKGEDVGSGYRTAQAALSAWSADPAQRGLLTDCDVKAVGVGVVAAGDGTLYWTADFGG
jgi:uncharacterized protein YkwD